MPSCTCNHIPLACEIHGAEKRALKELIEAAGMLSEALKKFKEIK